MEPKTVAGFWALVKRDAAVQEHVAFAAKQADPLDALVKVAADAGFLLGASELRRSLHGELNEGELERVSGGAQTIELVGSLIEARVSSFRAPGEWFAE
jgi:hypothetical protein